MGILLPAMHGAALETATVKWVLEPTQVKAARGEIVSIKLKAEIPARYHIYALTEIKDGPLPTVIEIAPPELAALGGEIKHPKPHVEPGLGFDFPIETFAGHVTFEIPLKIADAAPLGEQQAFLALTSQLCDDKNCLFPQRAKLNLTLTIREAERKTGVASEIESTPEPEAPAAPVLSGDEAHIAAAREKGLLAFLWVAMVAGGLALLTPCVFPMLPITVSFFTKRKEVSRRRSIRDAAIYAFGIIGTFTLIGMLFALVFGATSLRTFSVDPWVNLAIAGIFIALALNLFGVFEIPMPTEWLNKVDSGARQGSGVSGILAMAFVFSITSFTCTVPFIGAVLLAASKGEWFMPLLGMLGFSAVFAAPFFVLALFPTLLKSLPKSGGWLNSVKVVMGFLELAAALKFLSTADLGFFDNAPTVLPRELFFGVWCALCLLATLYLLGQFKFAHDSDLQHVGGVRILCALLFLSLALWFCTGLLGNTFGKLEAFIPPASKAEPSRSSAVDPQEQTWIVDDLEAAQAESRRSSKPLFVNFTGFT